MSFSPREFEWGAAIFVWVVGIVVGLLVLIAASDLFLIACGVIASVGVTVGIVEGREHWSEISYIKIGEVRDYTTVLVKVYDDDGNRNLDDDDILRLVELLEDLYAGEREVSASYRGGETNV